jgi:hypothetical protein
LLGISPFWQINNVAYDIIEHNKKMSNNLLDIIKRKNAYNPGNKRELAHVCMDLFMEVFVD